MICLPYSYHTGLLHGRKFFCYVTRRLIYFLHPSFHPQQPNKNPLINKCLLNNENNESNDITFFFFFLRNLTALNKFILKVNGDAYILPTYYMNICSFEFQYYSMSYMQRIPKDWKPSVILHREKCTHLWGSDTVTILSVPKTTMQHLVSGMQLPITKFSQGFVIAAQYLIFYYHDD